MPNLAALVAKNKIALGAAGAGGVVLLALARKRGAAKPAGATTPAYAGAAYDSTASDLYNSIQPQLEALQTQLAALASGTSSPQSVLSPATAQNHVAAHPGYVSPGHYSLVGNPGNLGPADMLQDQATRAFFTGTGPGNRTTQAVSITMPGGQVQTIPGGHIVHPSAAVLAVDALSPKR